MDGSNQAGAQGVRPAPGAPTPLKDHATAWAAIIGILLAIGTSSSTLYVSYFSLQKITRERGVVNITVTAREDPLEAHAENGAQSISGTAPALRGGASFIYVQVSLLNVGDYAARLLYRDPPLHVGRMVDNKLQAIAHLRPQTLQRFGQGGAMLSPKEQMQYAFRVAVPGPGAYLVEFATSASKETVDSVTRYASVPALVSVGSCWVVVPSHQEKSHEEKSHEQISIEEQAVRVGAGSGPAQHERLRRRVVDAERE